MTIAIALEEGNEDEEDFPVGLRVLVVDDNRTSLNIIEKMMMKCKYQVTTATRAIDALSMLQKKKNSFDLVITEVRMPDMDGFKLLEQIRLEMDIPVIVMSADYEKSVLMKGINHGACDYLIKPIPLEMVKTIWQHVVRAKMKQMKDLENFGSIDDGFSQDEYQAPFAADVSLCSEHESSWRSSTKERNEDGIEQEERDDSSTGKRRRLVWSAELHQKFVSVVNQLGVQKAVPKKILQLMDIPGITRENVASHLQKYRSYLRRRSGKSKHQNQIRRNVQLLNARESNFGEMSLLDTIDIQGFSFPDQLPLQAIPPARSVGVVDNHPNDPFICNTRFGYETHINGKDIIPLNINVRHGYPNNAIDPMQHQPVQSVRKTSLSIPLPYILLGDGSASIHSITSTIYNNQVPVQFPQPCPLLDYPTATKPTQPPLSSNGFPDDNTTTFLPKMFHDEESMDTEVLQNPTSDIVSRNSGV